MSTNTGGPAFPIPGLQHDEDFNGMTLRDYFAAKALPAVYVSAMKEADGLFQYECWRDGLAIDAYLMADAMLKARNES
jgi:hypothetical protein